MSRKKRLEDQNKIKQVTVSTRITSSMLERLNEYLISDAHVSISDYVRDLIRRDLETKGYRLYTTGKES
jgi:Arc/MetJ-type ribon-helix-helix transcriptional regulator